MKKADGILIALVLAVAFLYSAIGWLHPSTSTATVAVVTVNQKTLGTYLLSTTPSVKIPISENGHKNVVVVGEGKAQMIEADCPDQICVKSGAITQVGQTIVCLPNKVVVEIKGSGEGAIDELAQ